MTRRLLPATLPALVLILLATGCQSIGNQFFYGLEPTPQAPIDRVVYRLARAWEQTGSLVAGRGKDSLLTPAEVTLLEQRIALLDVPDPAAVSRMTQEVVKRILEARPGGQSPPSDGTLLTDLFTQGRLFRLGVRSAAMFVTPVDSLQEWRELPTHEALIRLQRDINGTKDISLDTSDQLVMTFPGSHMAAHFQTGVLRMRETNGYRFQTLSERQFGADPSRRAVLIRLTHELVFGDNVAYATSPPVSNSDVLQASLDDLRSLPELSFRPIDAEFSLHAIAPSLNPDGGAPPITKGMRLTILANRLYLGQIGEVLGDTRGLTWMDTGEIAVVVTVTDGGEEPRQFLAFYHDSMRRETFVPSLGAVLYSTESWSGNPLTVKLQVFDLDAGENTFFASLLNTAAESVAKAVPGAQEAVGIAGAIGELLVSQNSDNEIMRFEFTFVDDQGDNGTTRDVLRPYQRSYIMLRSDEIEDRLAPELVHIDDQWRARLADDESAGGRGVGHLDSYFTFTVSDDVPVPSALLANRQEAFRKLVDSGQMQSMSTEEKLESVKRAAAGVVSSITYLDYREELELLAAQKDYTGLLAASKEIASDESDSTPAGERKMTASDRKSLLQFLKRELPDDLRGTRTWEDVVTKLTELEKTENTAVDQDEQTAEKGRQEPALGPEPVEA